EWAPAPTSAGRNRRRPGPKRRPPGPEPQTETARRVPRATALCALVILLDQGVGKKASRAAIRRCRLPRIGNRCHRKPFAFCLSGLVRNLRQTSTIEENAFVR